MATWTAVGPDSFWYTSWVADMGPYIGPNPVSVDWLPPDAGEIDFFVGLMTGDLNTGVMSDRWADAYRYRRSDGSEQSRGVEVGTIGTDTFVTPGVEAHLYVQWWDPAYPNDAVDLVPPSLKPEQVVPCIYVRGGRGPYFGPGVTVPAHWSDWQPGFVASSGFVQGAWDVPGQRFCASLDTNAGTRDPANDPYEGVQYTHPPQPLPLPDRNLIDLGAESLARQRAGAAADDLFYLGGIDQVFGWKQYRIGSDGYPYDPTYQNHWFEAWTRIDQRGEVFVMPDAGSLPPPPGSFTTYEWEGSPTGTVQLRDQSVEIHNRGGFDWPGYQNFQSGTPLEHTATETFEIWAIPGTGPGADSIRVDPSTTGIKLLEFELSTHLHADHSVSYDPAQTLTIPYSMIPSSWAHFTLIYQPRLFHSGDGASLWYDIPTPDPTGPDNGTFRAYQYGIVPDGWAYPPPYDLHTPRYRYWIPEVYTPGALQCCPNQKLKITVLRESSAGRWSDWQPGFTYDLAVEPDRLLGLDYLAGTDQAGAFGDDDVTQFARALASVRAGEFTQPPFSGYGYEFHFEAHRSERVRGSDGTSYEIGAYVRMGYKGVTYRASGLAGSLPTTPPGGMPIGAGAIDGGATPLHPHGQLDYENAAASFSGWQGSLPLSAVETVSYSGTFRDGIHHLFTTVYPSGETVTTLIPRRADAWRPDPAFPLVFGAVPAVEATAQAASVNEQGGTPGFLKPLYIGPKILYSDLQVLHVAHFDTSNQGSNYPYKYTDADQAPVVTDYQDLVLPMASITEADVTLVAMPGYMNPAVSPVVPALEPVTEIDWGNGTDYDRADEFRQLGYYVAGQLPHDELNTEAAPSNGYAWLFSGAQRPIARFHTPRWRYWIPAVTGETTYECSGQPPYLRMTQRNDGLGISPHPQLGLRSTSSNNPGVAPRIGRAARYD